MRIVACPAVITAPSRELATQIYRWLVRLLGPLCEKEIRIADWRWGKDKARQIDKLQIAQPHIVIGTLWTDLWFGRFWRLGL